MSWSSKCACKVWHRRQPSSLYLLGGCTKVSVGNQYKTNDFWENTRYIIYYFIYSRHMYEIPTRVRGIGFIMYYDIGGSYNSSFLWASELFDWTFLLAWVPSNQITCNGLNKTISRGARHPPLSSPPIVSPPSSFVFSYYQILHFVGQGIGILIVPLCLQLQIGTESWLSQIFNECMYSKLGFHVSNWCFISTTFCGLLFLQDWAFRQASIFNLTLSREFTFEISSSLGFCLVSLSFDCEIVTTLITFTTSDNTCF